MAVTYTSEVVSHCISPVHTQLLKIDTSDFILDDFSCGIACLNLCQIKTPNM